MDKDDLEWLNCYKINDSEIFVSDAGVDTLCITNIQIFNSTNPINTNPNAHSDYIAGGYIDYIILHNGNVISGWFNIQKITQDSPLEINTSLDQRFAFHIKPDSILRLSEENSSLDKYNNQNNPIICFEWSKSKGLLSYIFKDGTTYKKEYSP